MLSEHEMLDYIQRKFYYNPDTGQLWRHFKKYSKLVTEQQDDGYIWTRITLNKKTRRAFAHRIAWVLYYGHFPSQLIDHINHNRQDNRICNLRDVSPRDNSLNRLPRMKVCPNCNHKFEI